MSVPQNDDGFNRPSNDQNKTADVHNLFNQPDSSPSEQYPTTQITTGTFPTVKYNSTPNGLPIFLLPIFLSYPQQPTIQLTYKHLLPQSATISVSLTASYPYVGCEDMPTFCAGIIITKIILFVLLAPRGFLIYHFIFTNSDDLADADRDYLVVVCIFVSQENGANSANIVLPSAISSRALSSIAKNTPSPLPLNAILCSQIHLSGIVQKYFVSSQDINYPLTNEVLHKENSGHTQNVATAAYRLAVTQSYQMNSRFRRKDAMFQSG